jgi:hypothetical protein
MPLLKVSQTRDYFNPKPNCSYNFAKEQTGNWITFWEEMDGDINKILEFAKESGIDNPQDWFDELHRFLFDVFSGNDKLLKKASKGQFKDFLAQVAENHVKNPKDLDWYYLKGTNPKEFIRVVEFASSFTDQKQAVAYINARVPEFGAKLFSEYILSKAPHKNEIVSIASKMNKEAYEIEKKISGKDIFDSIKVGSKIKHSKCGEEIFEVIAIDTQNEMFIVQDSREKEHYFFDVWNVKNA